MRAINLPVLMFLEACTLEVERLIPPEKLRFEEPETLTGRKTSQNSENNRPWFAQPQMPIYNTIFITKVQGTSLNRGWEDFKN